MARSPFKPRNLFSLRIKQFVAQTKADIDTVIKKIALDCFSKIILRSPVDTGRFRGNWQVEIGEMPAGTVALDDKEGTAAISAAQAKILDLKAGDIIFLVNNLPYAWPLENGHSGQAPNGMVELTVIEYQKFVDDAVAATKKKVS